MIPQPEPCLPRVGPRTFTKPNISEAVKRIMAARGLTLREFIRRVPKRHIGTVYRLVAGRTTDPWASTIASVCEALGCDPDELLGVRPWHEGFTPEERALVSDFYTLLESDTDREWVLAVMRAAIAALREKAAP